MNVVLEDLERRIRERGVRVSERLELVRLLIESENGAAELSARIAELAARMEQEARRVREVLR
jgi:predicted metal-dependent hydrolase